MGKFIINSILIEKSEKDIQTDVKYDFDCGFNIVKGCNEAGKTSLMQFIKDGFFRIKGAGAGKIFFSVNDKSYRADINASKAVEKRCLIFDNGGNDCSYDIISLNINQKYFEQGFFITLDDLMKIQNKETSVLIDLLKDPCADKLSSYAEKIEFEIDNVISKENNIRKDVKNVIDKINENDKKIKELSETEQEYNQAVGKIKKIDEELLILDKKSEYFNLLLKINEIEHQKKLEIDEKEKILTQYNSKLYENQKDFMQIIQQSVVCNSNNDLINKNNEKLEKIINTINTDRENLKIKYGISAEDKQLEDFNIDVNKINQLKNTAENINEIKSQINSKQTQKEDVQNDIIRLKKEAENIINAEKINSDELNKISIELQDGLKQYYFITSKINEISKSAEKKASNKNNIIMFIVIVLLSIITAIALGTLQKNFNIVTIGAIIFVVGLIGFINAGLYKNLHKSDEIKALEKKSDEILEELKLKVLILNPEIEKTDKIFLPSKLEAVSQDLIRKTERINKIKNDIQYLQERYNCAENKINELKQQITELDNEKKNIIDTNIISEEISAKDCIEITQLLQSVKSGLSVRNDIKNEVDEAQKLNSAIAERLQSFILENNINLTVSTDINEIVENLKEISEKNNELKNELNLKEHTIKKQDEEISNLLKLKNEFETEYTFSTPMADIKNEIENLSLQRSEKEKEKNEAAAKKLKLEEVEEISGLKVENRILLEKYEKIIKNLMINKMALALINEAKADYDKIQPDLMNAQKYLTELTGGKYTKINLEMQEIESADGVKIKKWETLSRGMREQLYLALRLAYASNYSKDKITLEPNGRADLPIIIDDAFVNFDEKRTKNALNCLKEISKTNQVFLFTCHDEIVNMLSNSDNGIKIINV